MAYLTERQPSSGVTWVRALPAAPSRCGSGPSGPEPSGWLKNQLGNPSYFMIRVLTSTHIYWNNCSFYRFWRVSTLEPHLSEKLAMESDSVSWTDWDSIICRMRCWPIAGWFYNMCRQVNFWMQNNDKLNQSQNVANVPLRLKNWTPLGAKPVRMVSALVTVPQNRQCGGVSTTYFPGSRSHCQNRLCVPTNHPENAPNSQKEQERIEWAVAEAPSQL